MFKKLGVFLTILLMLLPSIIFAQNVFDPVIEKLKNLGFFDILLFFGFLALIFAILTKSKILGDNVVINGLLSIVLSFGFAFIFPYLTGFNLVTSTTKFVTQAAVILLVFLFGLIAASIFYPDMTKTLTTVFSSPTMIIVMVIFGIVLFVTSGTITVFWAGKEPSIPSPTTDVVILIIALFIFVMMLFIAGVVGGRK